MIRTNHAPDYLFCRMQQSGDSAHRHERVWRKALFGATAAVATSLGFGGVAMADVSTTDTNTQSSIVVNNSDWSGLAAQLTQGTQKPDLTVAKPTPLRVAQATSAPTSAPAGCTGVVDPYKNYACLDTYLGDTVGERFFNYYRLEWGEAAAPTDPNAPSSHRDGVPTTPETTPPMPFTEWPYGGTTSLGVTLPGSVDSPFMAAIGNTGVGQWLTDNHFQIYGWVDPGMNLSSNSTKPGGNAPILYFYTPNTVQLDQAVIYLDRFPDTVQTDHIDWGLRISAIYGENYRYTTAYGIASYQLLHENNVNGFDFPMVYFELYVPKIGDFHLGEGGLMLRIGRFISLPDIEAQLAPNNYMYSHSLTYGYDNYTNEGIQASLGLTKNWILQLGLTVGTEAPPWHMWKNRPNPYPNPLYPNATMPVDPGSMPTVTGCFRWTADSGNSDLNVCADGINSGKWGYNNLQWYGFTAYHKFNDHWHISYELYDEHEDKVPNLLNPVVLNAVAMGGTPFSPQYVPFNAPGMAYCTNASILTCTASAFGTVAYINYSPDPLDNISFRPEFYDDMQGQRTGNKTRYVEFSFGWQHWLSPQIELRPEVGFYKSLNGPAFNGNSNAGIAPNKSETILFASDAIIHF